MLAILPMFVLMLLSPIAYPYIFIKLLLTDPGLLITMFKECVELGIENWQLFIQAIMQLISSFI